MLVLMFDIPTELVPLSPFTTGTEERSSEVRDERGVEYLAICIPPLQGKMMSLQTAAKVLRTALK
ncbi:hypothetical protein NQZ68_040393 [Dissostichus eleginoides]|nr:hypothetical protein NQZ68_040393 [Dissostichus eleginoides]